VTAQNDADDRDVLAFAERAGVLFSVTAMDSGLAIVYGRSRVYRACRRLVAAGKLVPHYGPAGKRVTRYSLAPQSLAEEARNIFPTAASTYVEQQNGPLLTVFTESTRAWAGGESARDPLVAVLKRQEAEAKSWWRGRLVRALRFIVGPPPGAFRE